MKIYPYHTLYVHDHKCDVCGVVIETLCTCTKTSQEELCEDCEDEYQRYVSKFLWRIQ